MLLMQGAGFKYRLKILVCEADSMETFQERLKRHIDSNDLEIFGWLTVYLHNAYWAEIYAAKQNRLYHCVYFMTHALIQMVSENMFGFRGKDGTRFYLESFVDGDSADTKFSLITEEIHDVRNVMAHQGYSSLQHRVEYFADEIAAGWNRDGNTVLINPKIYADQFEKALGRGTLVDKYQQLTDELRVIRKYQYLRQWLGLDRNSPIAIQIKKLEHCATSQDLRTQETKIRTMIYASYNLP